MLIRRRSTRRRILIMPIIIRTTIVITAIRAIIHFVVLSLPTICWLWLLRRVVVTAVVVGGVWRRGLLMSLVGWWREGTLRHPACAVHRSCAAGAFSAGGPAKTAQRHDEEEDDEAEKEPAAPVVPAGVVASDAAVDGAVTSSIVVNIVVRVHYRKLLEFSCSEAS